MYLKKLKLLNFRSYKTIEVEFDENLNVIIGKNDIGKSTILEALDIFFGQGRTKMEISDKNVFNGSKMEISCSFIIEKDKEYLIDTDVKTKLSSEYLLNSEGQLEIKKTWDCSKDKLTAASLKTFIICNYPTVHSKKPLPTLKIEDLRKILEKEDIAFAISEKQNNNQLENLDEGLTIGPYDPETDKVVPITIDKRKRADIRKAIYSVIDDLELKTIELPIDKEDSKNIWNSISNDLPLFFLFQSDRANKDTDKEVQDPLKVITKTAIENVIDKLEEVKDLIKKNAELIGKETIKKLEEMNPELAKVLKPEVTNKAWDTLFSFSFIGDDNIPMNKRGSGVRRLILLNYFRAEAERKNTSNKNVIYAIEEPETSQHPNHQTLLINALNEIAQKEKNQVILTTHSPEIAKQTKSEHLILIDKINGENKIIQDENKLKAIAETLGITAYLGKLVICLEGENDINFLLNLNQNISDFKEIIDLKKEDIKMIPMRGSSLKNWIDRNYLEGSNITEFHLYDKDSNQQYKSSIEKVNKRQDNSKGVLTSKREMENYIHPSLYEKEFEIDCSKIKDWDNADIAKIVTEKTKKIDVEIKEKERIVKQITNCKLTKELTKENLIEMNSFEEISNWFKEIKDLNEN
ncbi:ATP-binding protein [Polaribacter sp. AHE13PA]|jgi:predicted ATP-dependent endonuclease of OLD family|uniref:ATP-binding protein n=1 Tax=Polaribacter sp. AHE13PA TaxID=2745562 RepID=UPI001C4F1BEF|nr:ATP-binding protein [Polaribacter sp. AHE13PA]QXP65731.1 ATP-binding protein [Polaribacter sp. AHE13PA]